jgi:hypothetical protein
VLPVPKRRSAAGPRWARRLVRGRRRCQVAGFPTGIASCTPRRRPQIRRRPPPIQREVHRRPCRAPQDTVVRAVTACSPAARSPRPTALLESSPDSANRRAANATSPHRPKLHPEAERQMNGGSREDLRQVALSYDRAKWGSVPRQGALSDHLIGHGLRHAEGLRRRGSGITCSGVEPPHEGPPAGACIGWTP